jgi:hypothetical protein
VLWSHLLHLSFPGSPLGSLFAGLQGGSPGHAIKPAGQRFWFADGPCFAEKNEERGLESILRIMAIMEDAATDTQNHWPMTPHQGFKRRIFTMSEERCNQLRIGEPIRFLQETYTAKMSDDSAQRPSSHPQPR